MVTPPPPKAVTLLPRPTFLATEQDAIKPTPEPRKEVQVISDPMGADIQASKVFPAIHTEKITLLMNSEHYRVMVLIGMKLSPCPPKSQF